MSRCKHINRIPIVHKGQHLGSPSIGRCENEALPGMVLCYQHAPREAMEYHIRDLWSHLHPRSAKISEEGLEEK